MDKTLVALFVQTKVQSQDYQGLIDFILSTPDQQNTLLAQVANSKLTALNNDLTTGQSILDNSNTAIANIQTSLATIQVATPNITPPGGSFAGPTQVTLDDKTQGASLFFTLDGSVPDSNSQPYSGPVVLKSNTTLNVIAIAPGLVNSKIVTAVFTFS